MWIPPDAAWYRWSTSQAKSPVRQSPPQLLSFFFYSYFHLRLKLQCPISYRTTYVFHRFIQPVGTKNQIPGWTMCFHSTYRYSDWYANLLFELLNLIKPCMMFMEAKTPCFLLKYQLTRQQEHGRSQIHNTFLYSTLYHARYRLFWTLYSLPLQR